MLKISFGKYHKINAPILKKKRERLLERIMEVFFLWWSTNAQNKIPENNIATKYIHQNSDVTITERVSKYAQKIRQNQRKLFQKEVITEFIRIW